MSLNEFNIIETFFNHKKPKRKEVILGIGDDAAIVDVPRHQQLVISTDSLVSGIHFFPDTKPFDIGYKSLAVNLSDMAAMGAEPVWITLAITLPEANTSWLKKFSQGFFSIADKYHLQLIGGNTTRGHLNITVQIHGLVPRGKALTRAGAKPDDIVYVSGTLGDAAYALKWLQQKKPCDAKSLQRLHRPIPRVDLGLLLRKYASSAIDISDGLAGDLPHITTASKVGACIDIERIPLSPILLQQQKVLKHAQQVWQWALQGGDDYELCFTIPSSKQAVFEKAVKALSPACTAIGKITASHGIRWQKNGKKLSQRDMNGFEHF